jgi:RNA polymerase sigma-70 factor (ECF subfamily)
VPEAEEAPPATTEPTVVPADAGPENEVRAEPPPDPRPGPRLAHDPTSIERETELLREAHAASQRGEPREALALLEQHARLFPRGALVTERRGLRILALCEAGEVDTARGEAQVFLRGRPPAGLAQRVQRSCAGNAAEGSEAP